MSEFTFQYVSIISRQYKSLSYSEGLFTFQYVSIISFHQTSSSSEEDSFSIESIYSHYQHAHYVEDMDCTREIISELHPEYITSFDAIMQGRKIHIYNMFVMSSENASEYCQWLFPILFELEKRIDITQYDNYQKRVFGFIAERLFNVWLVHHQLKFCEIPVVNLEGENLLKKAINLLKRKFLR